MTDKDDQASTDTTVKPMIFSHATADQPASSPAVSEHTDEETRRDLFSARAAHPQM
jgi:hypothetical protein